MYVEACEERWQRMSKYVHTHKYGARDKHKKIIANRANRKSMKGEEKASGIVSERMKMERMGMMKTTKNKIKPKIPHTAHCKKGKNKNTSKKKIEYEENHRTLTKPTTPTTTTDGMNRTY